MQVYAIETLIGTLTFAFIAARREPTIPRAYRVPLLLMAAITCVLGILISHALGPF